MKYDKNFIKKRKEKAKQIKMIVFIVIIIVLYNVILLSVSYINKQEFSSFLGYKAYRITSNSMEPALNIGDVIITKEPKEEDDIKTQQIISFEQDGEIITHRVIQIIEEDNGQLKYITKGDNNNVEDLTKISFEDIKGVKVITIPYLGTIVSFLENKVVVLFIILIVLLLYLYKLNRDEKREMRREKRKNQKNIKSSREFSQNG